jgi:hypothetical protein
LDPKASNKIDLDTSTEDRTEMMELCELEGILEKIKLVNQNSSKFAKENKSTFLLGIPFLITRAESTIECEMKRILGNKYY